MDSKGECEVVSQDGEPSFFYMDVKLAGETFTFTIQLRDLRLGKQP